MSIRSGGADEPDAAWEAFAAREPYFAVLTDPKFLRANLTPAHLREFFASGEDLVSWILGVIDAGLAPQFAPVSTLEYGCGPGRLALPLARRPGAVTAVDRSPVMLDVARREAERHDLGHILFQTPLELFAAPRTFDLIVCYHVLQRLRPRAGMALLRRLMGLLGPSGVAVFQWPYRTADSRLVVASRWLRDRAPGANAVANALRGKRAGDPFIPTYTYDVGRMLNALDPAAFRSTHVAFEHHAHLDYALAFAQKPERCAPSAWASSRGARRRVVQGVGWQAPGRDRAADGGAPFRREVSDLEIDAYNRAADAYFTSLAEWDHHLAKPFSQMEETPTLLMSVAVLLQALRLTPGMTVLEFGAGSGWLSRFLTQMGCRVILLDVSPGALRIARELYVRQPVIGAQPPPVFLEFDGRRIALTDASVDRIVCFDAFHHAPNPDTVIREFARVLAPGGIAGFTEPGPRHAEAPRSQFEAHTYGVVELDVDVHAVWRTAQACGFRDLRMCVFHGPPYHVPLEDMQNLVAGGDAQEGWLASTRQFLRHVRSFCLVREGVERPDSRTPAGLACDIRAALADTTVGDGQPVAIDVLVTNTGTATWLASDAPHGGVALGTHLYDAAGALLAFDFHVAPLTNPPREIAPGETVRSRVTTPGMRAGRYRIELDCVAAHVTWFAQAGSPATVLTIDVVREEDRSRPEAP